VKGNHQHQDPEFGRRDFLCSCAMAMAGAALVGPLKALAQQAPTSAGPPSGQLIDDLVAANRILADQGVLDGFGHISVRHDKDPNRYLISRSLAPALVTAGDILQYDLDSRPIDVQGRELYSEVFIHGEIYKARPDVKAVVHNHSPAVIPFADTGVAIRPMYHMSSFIGQGVPVFDIRKEMAADTDILVRTQERGRALAKVLGNHPAVLMRGHGCVVVADAVQRAVFRSVYLQTNAALQAQAMALSPNVTYLTDEEAKHVEQDLWSKGRYLRAWDMWKQKAMGK
jgi:ribulose-5-phosphate 4-epimerase/fuculose-1-phosphate aldolase